MATGRVSDITRFTEAGTTLIFNSQVKRPMKKLYPEICTEVKETKKVGLYDTIGGIGAAAVKPEGDPVPTDSMDQGYQTSITDKTVAKGVETTREKLEYDLYGEIRKMVGPATMKVMLDFKEKEIADLYNHGFATNTGADGVYTFSASHPLINGGAALNSNLATGALTTDNLIKAKNMFIDIKDQAGGIFDTYATKLLINPKKQYQAMQILESQLVAFELSNTKNVANAIDPIKIVANRYIDYNTTTDVSPWFLIDDTLEDAGAILQTNKSMWLETEWAIKAAQIFYTFVLERYSSAFISPGYKVIGSSGA